MYDSAYLIAAQLVFAYAFDMVLTWSRRERYTLGFGPFPIIFSINLFLWFKVDWFYWQFLMIAIGFTVKELVRWNKDGRRTHIFNPSSFPLGLFSLVLIVTGTTRLTWGPEIATTLFDAPTSTPSSSRSACPPRSCDSGATLGGVYAMAAWAASSTGTPVWSAAGAQPKSATVTTTSHPCCRSRDLIAYLLERCSTVTSERCCGLTRPAGRRPRFPAPQPVQPARQR